MKKLKIPGSKKLKKKGRLAIRTTLYLMQGYLEEELSKVLLDPYLDIFKKYVGRMMVDCLKHMPKKDRRIVNGLHEALKVSEKVDLVAAFSYAIKCMSKGSFMYKAKVKVALEKVTRKGCQKLFKACRRHARKTSDVAANKAFSRLLNDIKKKR